MTPMQQQPQGQPVAQPKGPAQQQKPAGPEQDAARRLVMRVMSKLYESNEMAANVVNLVQSGDDPAQGLAKATMYVMDGVRAKAQGQGDQIIDMATPAVALYIAELAVLKKIIPDDSTIFGKALQIIIEQRAGTEQNQQPQTQGEQPQEPAAPAAQQAPASLLNAPVG